MKNPKSQFITDGRLTVLSIFCLVLGGFAVVYLSLEFLPSKGLKIVGLSIGLGIAAVGGFSGRASALDRACPEFCV